MAEAESVRWWKLWEGGGCGGDAYEATSQKLKSLIHEFLKLRILNRFEVFVLYKFDWKPPLEGFGSPRSRGGTGLRKLETQEGLEILGEGLRGPADEEALRQAARGAPRGNVRAGAAVWGYQNSPGK